MLPAGVGRDATPPCPVDPLLLRGHDDKSVTELATRHVAVVAVLAGLSFLVAACGGGPAHNSVASLGQGKTTTTVQPSAPRAGESPFSYAASGRSRPGLPVGARSHRPAGKSPRGEHKV